MNTQEQKPITNSRDTQELQSDAGVEVLRIFVAYKQRTSLLEDFGYYEMQAAQRSQQPKEAGNERSSNNSTPVSASAKPGNSGFVKTFNPSGPPSLGPGGGRFTVLGGSMNGRGGIRGTNAR